MDSSTKLYGWKKRLQKQMRDVEKLTAIQQNVVDEQKERCRQELQEIEQDRNDLLPEHEKTQKKSQKLQSLQDKKKQRQRDAGDMEKVRDEIAEREVLHQELMQKAPKKKIQQKKSRMKESESCKQETKGQVALRRSQTDVVSTPPSLFTMKGTKRVLNTTPNFERRMRHCAEAPSQDVRMAMRGDFECFLDDDGLKHTNI